MKTPRQLILERHRSAEARLETIRAEDLAACTQTSVASDRRRLQPFFSLSYTVMKLWQESLWPWRRAWTGMAVVWLVLLALNLTIDKRAEMAGHKAARPSPELLAALREQRQLLLQWFEPSAPPPLSPRRLPGPRSEQQPAFRRG